MKSPNAKGTTPKNEKRRWLPMIGRCLLLTTGISLVTATLSALVFWDANFYVARDRWEHFKLAIVGEWQNTGWCPPGQNVPGCGRDDNRADEILDRDHSLIYQIFMLEVNAIETRFEVICETGPTEKVTCRKIEESEDVN